MARCCTSGDGCMYFLDTIFHAGARIMPVYHGDKGMMNLAGRGLISFHLTIMEIIGKVPTLAIAFQMFAEGGRIYLRQVRFRVKWVPPFNAL